MLYSKNLEAMLEAIEAGGGQIVRPIYSFPGGRRFHFTDPAGNELAVWGSSCSWGQAPRSRWYGRISISAGMPHAA